MRNAYFAIARQIHLITEHLKLLTITSKYKLFTTYSNNTFLHYSLQETYVILNRV